MTDNTFPLKSANDDIGGANLESIPLLPIILPALKDSRCNNMYYRGDINTWDYNLHSAVCNGNIAELVKLQKINRNTFSIKNEYEETLLHLSAEYGQLEMTIFLLKHLNVNVKSSAGYTPLHRATWRGNNQMIELLKENGAELNAQDKCGKTALHYAVLNVSTEVVKLLLRMGADTNMMDENVLDPGTNIIDRQPTSGRTPLHYAIERNNMEIITMLLSANTNVNLQDHKGRTSLHLAVEYESKDIVDVLLDNGADVNVRDAIYGHTPLHYVIVSHNMEIVKILLNANADVNLQDHKGWTSLHLAIYFDRKDIVNMLTDHGADVNASRCSRDRTSGFTLPHDAMEYKNTDIIALLLTKGADVNLQDNEGISALRLAYDKKLDITNLLLENAVDIEVTDQVSYRFVEKAMSLNVPDILKCLIVKNQEDEDVDGKSSELTAEYLESILDNCIGVDNKIVYVSYNALLPRNFKNLESLLLIFMCISKETKYEHLLLHPTTRSFLLWKWGQLSKYFYINLLFFLLTCAHLLTYQFLFYFKEKKLDAVGYTLYSIIVLNVFILIIRELVQLFINWRMHLKDVENYFEFALIIYILLILSNPMQSSYKVQLVAIGNVLIAVTLTLLIGHHPIASSAIHLLRTVTFKFIKYFVVYLLIILSFSLSFYQLYKDSGSQDDILQHSNLTILRTMGMFIGELSLNELFSENYSFAIIILMLSFMIFVSVIILNLLNGLAISNILEKRELDISRYKYQFLYLYNLNNVLNIVFRILGTFTLTNILANKFLNTFHKNVGDILLLRNYINYNESWKRKYHVYNNKLHKDAYERLKYKTIRKENQERNMNEMTSQNTINQKMIEENIRLLEERLTHRIEELLRTNAK